MLIDPGRTRAAVAGDAVNFASLAAFGDVRGTGIATDYESVRDGTPSTSGWTTHAITPPQAPFTLLGAFHFEEPEYLGDFSSDLSQGIFRAWSPLGSAPNVDRVENLYLRSDLRTAGGGTYTLLSNAFAPVGSDTDPLMNVVPPRVAGSSSDFGHVIFESAYKLTADATADPGGPVYNLYDWDHGTLKLAGVLPDGSAAGASIAGQGASKGRYTERTISADGSRVFFTDNLATASVNGALYMRVNSATTVQINASERTDCADHNPCSGTPEPDPSGSLPATFGTASIDGSRAFFVSQEALTDNAPGGSGQLYMYDARKPDSDPHNLSLLSVAHNPSDSSDVQGVIGASDDGRYVYFIAKGQLVAGAPVLSGQLGIFLWHDDGTPDGTLAYVGKLNNIGDAAIDLPQAFSLKAFQARVTPDGRHLVFLSHSGDGLLSAHGGTDYDHGSCPGNGFSACAELYLFSADSQRLQCVSCNPSGAPATADAQVWVRSASAGGSQTTTYLNHPMTTDGSRVFFTTGEALVPEDTNHALDAYEYDTADGSVHLLSSGTDPSDSYFMDASANGDDVFIATRSQLVGWDTDSSYDIYDVRVHGGVPDPAPPTLGCAGEGCRGPLDAPPTPLSLGSPSIAENGNVKATVHRKKPKPVRCRRGFVRRKVRGKVRCVKAHAHPAKGKRAAHRGGAW